MRENTGQERASIHDLTIMIRHGKIDLSNVSQVIDKAIKYLRSHEWVRLDDVVDGVWKCTLDKFCELKERNKICHHNITECPNRKPATIADLIGGDK